MSLEHVTPTLMEWQRYNALMDQDIIGIPQVPEDHWKVAALEYCLRKTNVPSPQQFVNWRDWAIQLTLGVV